MSQGNQAATTSSRRDFLKSSSALAGGAAVWSLAPGLAAAGYRSPNERPTLAYIGLGTRYPGLLHDALPFGPVAAICDVDTAQLENGLRTIDNAYQSHGVAAPRVDTCEDYRRLLDRSDIDAVVIVTPDHWHTKMAIEALRAGKDVYCEKPLTHHVAEGSKIVAALEETGGVMQVGAQQRSDRRFQTAAAMTRAQRAGAVKRITCGIDGGATSGVIPLASPPSGMNWNRWLGPAPWVPYRQVPNTDGQRGRGVYASHIPFTRGHAHFRWWYEYAGGKLTDWGAHHVDIAMWSLGKSDAKIGKFTIDPIKSEHPVEFKDGYPVVDDRFNTATAFHVRVAFEDGVELDIVDHSERLDFGNGIMFECENGRYFVNRGKLTGAPVDGLKENPLPDSAYAGLYEYPAKGENQEGRGRVSHMKNFFDCVKSRETPICDVASHHRHLTVCHLANIALRLNRKLTFDPAVERFVGDEQADGLLSREYRQGFEIEG